MTGRYFVVVEPDGDSFAFESMAKAKECEDAWDRDFYRSKPNRIVECIPVPRVTGSDGVVSVNGEIVWVGIHAQRIARDLRRALRGAK